MEFDLQGLTSVEVVREYPEQAFAIMQKQAKELAQQPHAAIVGLCDSCCCRCVFNGSRKGRKRCSDYVGFAPK